MSTKTKATTKVTKTADARSTPTASGDTALVRALRLEANVLRGYGQDDCRMAAFIIDWAATPEGKGLRDLISAFKARQESAPTLEQVLGNEKVISRRRQYEANLDLAKARWEAEVLSDENGKPAEIDVVDHIVRMACWVATAKEPSSWLRRKVGDRANHLKTVKAKALELAALLDIGDGPSWPSAIELFDKACQPVWDGDNSFAKYRVHVADRMKAQQLSGLLRNLAASSERQARLDDLHLREMPRPNTIRIRRLMAKRAEWWFKNQCRLGAKAVPLAVIADLINATRPPKALYYVDEFNVKEWLRPPRQRGAKPPTAK